MRQQHWRRAFTTTTVCFASSMTPKLPPPLRSSSSPLPTLRGIVFDMDGTLTVPNLDFAEMYRRCGVSRDADILQVLRDLPETQAQAKYDIIREMEQESVRTMQLLPGAREVLEWIQAHRIPMALVTRNTLVSARAFQAKLPVTFDVMITRDSSDPPLLPKPDPAAMWHILNHWQVEEAGSVVMVGDSFANDIEFGKAAGTATVWLDMTNSRQTTATGSSTTGPDVVTIDHLYHLPQQLWQMFDIAGELGTHSLFTKKHAIPRPTTPATMAAATGNLDGIVEYHDADDTGNTPLIWAANGGHVHVVEQLLNYGVDHNVRGYLGATAVCRAARQGHVRVVELLIQAGADVNIPNNKRQYPLHFAAFQQKLPVVQVLLESGVVNTHVLDRKGRVPAMDTQCATIRNTILASM